MVFLADMLRPFIERLLEANANPDALVFGLTTEIPFEPKNVARKAQTAWRAENKRREEVHEGSGEAAKLGLLEPITLHEARHSFSTFLDHAGVSEACADRYMVHSNGSVAGRYRHLLPGQIAEDRKLFDAYLEGVTAGKVVPLTAAQ